jgi:hypothetical protein
MKDPQFNLIQIPFQDFNAGFHYLKFNLIRLEYKTQEKQWIVVDGNGKRNSTNGTWLFVEDPFTIFDGMIFKAGQTLFKLNIF